MKRILLSFIAATMMWAGAAKADVGTDVDNLYQFVLGRHADPGGLVAFANAVIYGGWNYDQVRYALAFSQEAANDVVFFYQSRLGRNPESVDAINAWRGDMYWNGYGHALYYISHSAEGNLRVIESYQVYLARNPESQGAVDYWAEFNRAYGLASMHYYISHSGEVQNDIQSYYNVFLLRNANGNEIGYWADRDNESGLGFVANAIAYSQEARNDVAAFYSWYLGRGAGSNEIDYWVGQNRNLGLNAVKYDIATSGEARNDINSYYVAYVGRNSSTDEQNYWLNQNFYITLNTVRVYIATSAEAKGLINAAYVAYLGRNASGDEQNAWVSYMANGGNLNSARYLIAHSGEAQNNIVAAFRADYGRDPSADELKGCVEYVYNNGIANGRYALANNTEGRNHIFQDFKDITGAGPDSETTVLSYVKTMADGGNAAVRKRLANLQSVKDKIAGYFKDYLGRTPTDKELADCVNYVAANGIEAGRLALYNSDEAKKARFAIACDKQVKTLFSSMLKRDPTAAELASVSGACVSADMAGNDGSQAAATLIANSDDGKKVIKSLFSLILGRDPSDSELASIVTELSKNGYLGVAVKLATSDEAVTDLIKAFNDVLARDPDSKERDHYTQLLASLGIDGVQALLKKLPEAQQMENSSLMVALTEAEALLNSSPEDKVLNSVDGCSAVTAQCVSSARQKFLAPPPSETLTTVQN